MYLPAGERDLSLRELGNALVRISESIKSRIPGTRIITRKIKGTDFLNGLLVQREETTVKSEPNLVLRGTVLPPERRILSRKAQDLFEMTVECRTLAADELYAGKICAALDRQHPRDLFDIHMLFREGNLSAAMRKAFIVYLISHDRPMVELLQPGLIDIT